MQPSTPVSPPRGGDWVSLCHQALPVEQALAFVADPSCGGVVLFVGVVRDHSDGRRGVTGLTYEAYEEPALDRLAEVVAEARRRWPQLGRVAVLHRVGDAAVGDPTVVVAASAPHRAEAFDGARFMIDTLKATAPIWKREHWDGHSEWAVCDHDLRTAPAGG